jgi:hypothetical protein
MGIKSVKYRLNSLPLVKLGRQKVAVVSFDASSTSASASRPSQRDPPAALLNARHAHRHNVRHLHDLHVRQGCRQGMFFLLV